MMIKNLAIAAPATAGHAESWELYEAATSAGVTRLGWLMAWLGAAVFVAAFTFPAESGLGALAERAHGVGQPLNSIAAIGGVFGFFAGIALLGLASALRGDFAHD